MPAGAAREPLLGDRETWIDVPRSRTPSLGAGALAAYFLQQNIAIVGAIKTTAGLGGAERVSGCAAGPSSFRDDVKRGSAVGPVCLQCCPRCGSFVLCGNLGATAAGCCVNACCWRTPGGLGGAAGVGTATLGRLCLQWRWPRGRRYWCRPACAAPECRSRQVSSSVGPPAFNKHGCQNEPVA